MIACKVCREKLMVMHRPGSGLMVWAHHSLSRGGLLYDHDPQPEGEGVVRLEGASRSLKIALDSVQSGGNVHRIAETLRLASFQIVAFQTWADDQPEDAMLAGAMVIDPEFDAQRAFIPDSPEGLI